MQKYLFNILTVGNYRIAGDICINTKQKSPICIVIHGFKGHKDWGFLPYLSEQIAQNSIISIKYNFSLNGYDSQDKSLINIDKFQNMSISRQLEELDIVISKLKSNTLTNELNLEELWDGNIFLCGHSMGAAVSILYSSIYTGISKLVLLASISKFDRYTPRQKNIWKSQGYIAFPNNKTGQMLRLNSSFLEDLEINSERFNLPNAISKLEIPILLVHGKQDLTVQIKEPNELIDAANPKYLKPIFIDNAGHTFNIENKGITNNVILEETVKDIIDFL